jgi:hypothetical protein
MVKGGAMNYRRLLVALLIFTFLVPASLFLLSSCASFDDPSNPPEALQEKKAANIESASSAGDVFDIQAYRDRPLEKIVTVVPNRISKNIGNNPDLVLTDLVRYLTEDESDPFLKVKNLHDWICDNIAYDAEGYFTGSYSGTDYTSVLRSGKTVCDGYAGLFLSMAEIAGFQAVKISGHSKGYGFDPVHKESRVSSHAWNGVEINGNWYLLDCTWNAGHVTTEGFTKDYSTGYLFLKPEYMIFSHHPDQDNWQLLDKPVPYDDYLDLHFFQGDFFNYLSVDTGGKREQIERFPVDREAKLELPKRREVFVTAQLVDADHMPHENRTYVDNDENTVIVQASFPSAGLYRIRLFGYKGMEGQWLGDIIVQAEKGSKARMPLVYSNFIEKQFRIIEPEQKYLIKGKTGTVALYAPGWEKAMVKMGDKSHEMKAVGGDIFRIDLPAVTTGEIDIFGSADKNSNSYEGACKIYAVE